MSSSNTFPHTSDGSVCIIMMPIIWGTSVQEILHNSLSEAFDSNAGQQVILDFALVRSLDNASCSILEDTIRSFSQQQICFQNAKQEVKMALLELNLIEQSPALKVSSNTYGPQ